MIGENTAISDSTVNKQIADLSNLIQNFGVKNILNCDKTGLFYSLLPDKIPNFKEETCYGDKHSKCDSTFMLQSR